MATSVSASRWRTAWNRAMGWPNCTRSSACSRASSSMRRDAPTSSWPSASCPRATAGLPVDRPDLPRPADLTGHLDEAQRGIDPLDRTLRQRRASRPRRRRATRRRGPRSGAVTWSPSPRGPDAVDGDPSPVERAGGGPPSDRREHAPRVRRRPSAAGERPGRAPRTSTFAGTLQLERAATPRHGRRPTARPAIRARPARRRAPRRCGCSVACRRLRSNSSRSSPSIIGRSPGRAGGGR